MCSDSTHLWCLSLAMLFCRIWQQGQDTIGHYFIEKTIALYDENSCIFLAVYCIIILSNIKSELTMIGIKSKN